MNAQPIRIAHLATGLGMGGAENTLATLLARLDRERFQSEVFSLSTDEPLGPHIRRLGVPVTALGLPPGRLTPGAISHLAYRMRSFRPDLIQTWMYHADFVGSLLAPLVGSPPVVWNVRVTLKSPAELKIHTRLVVSVNVLLSRLSPKRIVYCAEAAQRDHVRLGFAPGRGLVIPNGFDLAGFAPDPSARDRVRAALGLASEAFLIGMAARFHPQKDHRMFITAAARLHSERPDAYFVLWGQGMDWGNHQLSSWIDSAGLRRSIHLLGLRQDAPELTAALDIATISSSFGEAFPRVVGEAMACGVPCAVTDVGDAALIVSDTGLVSPPGDAAALSANWLALAQMPGHERVALGQQARRRILENYSLERMLDAYARLYEDIITARRD